MKTTGRVVNVTRSYAGSALWEDAAAAATTLKIDTASDFNEAGGTADIAGVVYTYSNIQTFLDHDTIDITPGLTAIALEGVRVDMLPSSFETLLEIRTVDAGDAGDTVVAVMDHMLQISLTPGERTPGAGEWVTMDDSFGRWVVTQVWNEEVAVTVTGPINLADHSDTFPPPDAPVLVASPFAVGSIQLDWSSAGGPDPVTYDVWTSMTTPVAQTSATYAGETTSQTFRAGQADSQPIVGEDLVYAVVRGRDVDGNGTNSNTASAAPRTADSYITALFIAALEIQANQIIAGEFIADLGVVGKLLVGNRCEIDGETGSIVIYAPNLDSDGNKVPLIELRPEGSTFRGRVIADDISVMNGIILQGLLSQIAAGAGLTIMAGVADPTQKPTLSQTVNTASAAIFPAPPSGHLHRGWCDHPTAGKLARLLWESAASVIKVQTINIATGTVDSTMTLGQVPGIGENAVSGLVFLYDSGGNGWYASVVQDWNQEYYGPGNGLHDVQYLVAWDAVTGAHEQTVGEFTTEANTDRSATYATLGVILGPFVQTIGFQVRNYPNDGQMYLIDDPGDISWSFSSVVAPSEKFVYFRRGDFDLPGTDEQFIGGHAASTSVLTSYDDFNTLQPLGAGPSPRYQWSIPAGAEVHWHDAENVFYALSGNILYSYSSYYPATNEKAWVTYSHKGAGALTTLDSPAESIALVPRRFLNVSLPGYPTGVTSADIFMGLGTTLPTDDNLKKRAETLTASRTMTIDPSVAGGAAHPTLKTITTRAVTDNVVTVTTSAVHGYAIGNGVLVNSSDATINGTFTIVAVPTTTTFTYALTHANQASGAVTGTTEANTFGSGGSGWLKTALGGFALYGDGTGDWRRMSRYVGITSDKTATQTITTNTPSTAYTLVTWTARPTDKGRTGMITWDSGTSSYVNSSTEDMVVEVRASLGYTGHATGARWIALRKTTPAPVVSYVRGKVIQTGNTGVACMEVETKLTLAPGDKIAVVTAQNSGGNLDIVSTLTSSAGPPNEFSIEFKGWSNE